jgi:hypothetical protein
VPDYSTAFSNWSGGLLVIAGIVVNQWYERGKERRSAKRAEEIRRAERRDKLLERRAEFQRPILLEMQEVAQQLIRAAMESMALARKASTSGMRDGSLSGDIGEAMLTAQLRIQALAERVQDGRVRDTAYELRLCCAIRVPGATHSEAMDAAWSSALSEFYALNERIGEALRKLDDIEDQITTPPSAALAGRWQRLRRAWRGET